MTISSRVSAHGHDRVQQRLGLPSKAVDRNVANALARGRKRTDFSGDTRKYLDKLWQKGRATNAAVDILVYGSVVYLFKGTILVTTWPLPARLIGDNCGEKCYGQDAT